MPPTNHRSKLQFFRYLPPEIVIDILARLPIRTIVICKCVCSSWRDLLATGEFADFHLSKSSVPGLVIGDGCFEFGPKDLRIFEFDDEIDLEHHGLHYKPLAKIESMELTGSSYNLQGSANGLVLLHRSVSEERDALFVCNPITREYIELLYDKVIPSTGTFSYGFGVSKMTGLYKVVRIPNYHNNCHDGNLQNITMSTCFVYTLGTGMWRSITLPAPFQSQSDDNSIGVCLNGNLHWFVLQVLDVMQCILSFDLETETSLTFSVPSSLSGTYFVGLTVLRDHLCVSDNNEDEAEVVIWLMKEYGDDKSWTKEFVITKSNALGYDYLFGCSVVNPIKVFKDGDILMVVDSTYVFYYYNKTKTIQLCLAFVDKGFCETPTMKAMLHISSLFPLSNFVNERVSRC